LKKKKYNKITVKDVPKGLIKKRWKNKKRVPKKNRKNNKKREEKRNIS